MDHLVYKRSIWDGIRVSTLVQRRSIKQTGGVQSTRRMKKYMVITFKYISWYVFEREAN